MMKIYLLISIMVLLPFMASSSLAQDYIVGDGDVLRITVYDHPDLTTVARISEDGAILFPLIGQVGLAGLTVSQTAEKISSLLDDGYIVNPQVTVFIEEFRSNKAVIMGQVNKPGLYMLKGRTTFLELLSKTGGLTDDAGKTAIIKRKPTPGENEKKITIDLKKLLEEGDTSLDIEIMDSDSIYISKAGVFFVTGEVRKPSAYKFEEGTTVVKAITMAGGFSDKAATGRVKIIRKVNDEEMVFNKVNMDAPVKPDDVIVVPESFF
jgi:polysaccharide export outer membrane protein